MKERFFRKCKLSNHNNNKFILLLEKDVYPYEYMDEKDVYPYEYIDDWKKFDETLPEKEDFYSNLDMEDITDGDYVHLKRVGKDFETKNLGKYYDFYVESDILLLADVSENFRNMCLKIYKLDPTRFLTAPGLALQATLKKTKVKLYILIDIDMLLMVKKIRRGIFHSIH